MWRTRYEDSQDQLRGFESMASVMVDDKVRVEEINDSQANTIVALNREIV